MYLRCSSVFFFCVLLQSDNEFKGTKFATFMVELKKGSFKLVTTCYIQYESKGVTFTFYHHHFESEIQIQYYCILRIHACVPLKFPLKKKNYLRSIFFLYINLWQEGSILRGKKQSNVKVL